MRSVAIVHDYLTQRGGAERVVLALLTAFPGVPVYTSLYDRAATYPEFQGVEIHTSALNRVQLFRSRHRLSLPLLALAFSRMRVTADVTICSSSGWAHGARTTGRKIVYCYTPARWLYQTEPYLGPGINIGGVALRALAPYLRAWDSKSAASANRYLAISTSVRDRISTQYGIEAEVLAPPPAISPSGPREPIEGVVQGYFLCVSRLLPYKNVHSVVDAFRTLESDRLVIVGTGPSERELRRDAPPNVRLLGRVNDANLRWLYERCVGVVSAAYEDFGLVPLEAASFGKPSAALAWGGFLDTVRPGVTGVLFGQADALSIAAAARELRDSRWSEAQLRSHADTFSLSRFVERFRRIVAEG